MRQRIVIDANVFVSKHYGFAYTSIPSLVTLWQSEVIIYRLHRRSMKVNDP
jgi:hypothetical protein